MDRISKISTLFKRLKEMLRLGSYGAIISEWDLWWHTIWRVTHFDYAHKQFNIAIDEQHLKKLFDEKNFDWLCNLLIHELLHIIIWAPSKTREDEPTVKNLVWQVVHDMMCNRALEREEQKVSDMTWLLMEILFISHKKKLNEFKVWLFNNDKIVIALKKKSLKHKKK